MASDPVAKTISSGASFCSSIISPCLAAVKKNRTVASLKYIANSRNVIRTDDSRVIFDVKNIWKPSNKISVQVFANVNYYQ